MSIIIFLIFICPIYSFILPTNMKIINNIYDKKITYKTFFDNTLTKINSLSLNKDIQNIKKDFTIMNNNYNKSFIINNEFDFLFNKKIKVYIHLEQLFAYTNIYHIGITYKTIYYKVRFDIGTFERYNIALFKNKRKVKKIFWGYSNKTFNEILNYENNMKYKYRLGIYDCRHYVRDLTNWSCNNPTPIWRLNKYF